MSLNLMPVASFQWNETFQAYRKNYLIVTRKESFFLVIVTIYIVPNINKNPNTWMLSKGSFMSSFIYSWKNKARDVTKIYTF